MQSGSYLIGVEADGFWSGIKGNDAGAVASGAFPITSIDADNLRWGGTLRARGGFTVDRWLMFFTGGWAYGDQVHTNTDPVNGVDQFTTHGNGLTAGGGIEYAMTNNLIGKVEYRYYNFNAIQPRRYAAHAERSAPLSRRQHLLRHNAGPGLQIRRGRRCEILTPAVSRSAADVDLLSRRKRQASATLPAWMQRTGIVLAAAALCSVAAGCADTGG